MIGIYFTNEEAGASERLVALSRHPSVKVKNYVTGYGYKIVKAYVELYILRNYKTAEARHKAVNQMETRISQDGLVVSSYRNLNPYKPAAPKRLKLVARFRFQPFIDDDGLMDSVQEDIDALS